MGVPHTMSRMGDVLAGFHAAWEFDSDSVLIRYERGCARPSCCRHWVSAGFR